jgi:glycosyltransferase involved in cell wall biosynthesis
MKLHTVMVTYNRLESTKQSIASFLETVTVPWSLTIVDNGSTDGTREWLADHGPFKARTVALGENRYPGYACNLGWSYAPDDATHLQRADNDWTFLPGWCDVVQEAFENPLVGQVGLRTDREESDRHGKPIPWNVGGNNIIRRSLWDAGLRYDERPWPELPAGHSEDTYLSPAVSAMGFEWQRVAKPCIVGNSRESKRDPYYIASYKARRIYGFR